MKSDITTQGIVTTNTKARYWT